MDLSSLYRKRYIFYIVILTKPFYSNQGLVLILKRDVREALNNVHHFWRFHKIIGIIDSLEREENYGMKVFSTWESF